MQVVELPNLQFETRPEVRERLLKTAVTRTRLLRLAMRGMHAKAAAEVVGVSPQTARMHYADPDFRRAVLEKVNDAFADVDSAFEKKIVSLHERLEEQAARSFDELVLLAADTELHPALKVKIHQDFLNRVDESKPLSGTTTKFDATQLQRAALVAREMDKVTPIRKSG